MGDNIWTRITVLPSDTSHWGDDRRGRLERLLGALGEQLDEGDSWEDGGETTDAEISFSGITGWGLADLEDLRLPDGTTINVYDELVELDVAFQASSEAKFEHDARALFWRPGWPTTVERSCDQDGAPVITTGHLRELLDTADDLADLRSRLETYLDPWTHGPSREVDHS